MKKKRKIKLFWVSLNKGRLIAKEFPLGIIMSLSPQYFDDVRVSKIGGQMYVWLKGYTKAAVKKRAASMFNWYENQCLEDY